MVLLCEGACGQWIGGVTSLPNLLRVLSATNKRPSFGKQMQGKLCDDPNSFLCSKIITDFCRRAAFLQETMDMNHRCVSSVCMSRSLEFTPVRKATGHTPCLNCSRLAYATEAVVGQDHSHIQQ